MVDYDLRPVSLSVVEKLCERYHGYGGCGRIAAYAFAVFENDYPVAAYAWQPPPPAAARAIAPAEPAMVLALSRMVAVPKAERALNHVSRPLRRQMKHLIDRTRWPALVTYSDEGEGHTGHTYKCSGWQATARNKRPFYVDDTGIRRSSYRNGGSARDDLQFGGYTWLQRWEHWLWPKEQAHLQWARYWERCVIPGKTWRSGSPAYAIVKVAT